jgi:small GTP-binding protein
MDFKKNQKNIHIKCVLLGNSGVGKTSIMERYIKNSFNPNRQTTLGAMFFTQNIIINNEVKLKIDFWDTAGQERYHSLVPMYIRDVDIVILTYDTNNLSSFESLNKWVKYVDNNHRRKYDIKIILIGNKDDLTNKVNENDVANFTSKGYYDYFHIRVSAKNNYNFDLLKEKIINYGLYLTKNNIEINDESTTIEEPLTPVNKSCC